MTHRHLILANTDHQTTAMADPPPPPPSPSTWKAPTIFLLLLVFPVLLSLLAYQAMDFDAAELPKEYFLHDKPISVPHHNNAILDAMDRVGDGQLPGPEDFAYDPGTGYLYTGCADGWIKRVNILGVGAAQVQVENWAFVGGHPLGVAFSPDRRRLYVANAHKGLMAVESDGSSTKVLVDEAEGLRFGLTDGIGVAADGAVYFSDASYKYKLEASTLDILEGRPHGRLLSFDPKTNQTKVLIRDLYFANGVVVSPTQESLIFCETPLRRCRRYHIHGSQKGTIDDFIENLPGYPDNARYDGDGSYWIGISSKPNAISEFAFKHPFLRNVLAFVEKNIGSSSRLQDGGVLEVSLDGRPVSLWTDPRLELITGGMKIGEHLYLGHLRNAYIGRMGVVASR